MPLASAFSFVSNWLAVGFRGLLLGPLFKALTFRYVVNRSPRPIFQPISASSTSVQHSRQSAGMSTTRLDHRNPFGFNAFLVGWALKPNTARLISKLLVEKSRIVFQHYHYGIAAQTANVVEHLQTVLSQLVGQHCFSVPLLSLQWVISKDSMAVTQPHFRTDYYR